MFKSTLFTAFYLHCNNTSSIKDEYLFVATYFKKPGLLRLSRPRTVSQEMTSGEAPLKTEELFLLKEKLKTVRAITEVLTNNVSPSLRCSQGRETLWTESSKVTKSLRG